MSNTPDPSTAEPTENPTTPEPAPRPSKHALRVQREERRATVAVYLLSHRTYREIAEAVGCSVSTVHGDVAVIRREWQARYAEEYDAIVAEELARCEALERAWLPVALNPGDDVTAAAQASLVLDRVGKQKARLLGLNQPVQAEVVVRGGRAAGPEASMEAKVARALQLVREVEGVEQVERQAIEAGSRIVGDAPIEEAS